MVIRLEAKKAVRRTNEIATAFIFEAAIPRDVARRRLIDDFLALFGGETRPAMTYLIGSGRLTSREVHEAERHLNAWCSTVCPRPRLHLTGQNC
jgi:BlaI family transcriptional regulator, penicillinase repressor